MGVGSNGLHPSILRSIFYMGPENMVSAMQRHFAKGAMQTKYKFGSIQRLLCLNNNDADFITKFKQIIKIMEKADEPRATYWPFFAGS